MLRCVAGSIGRGHAPLLRQLPVLWVPGGAGCSAGHLQQELWAVRVLCASVCVHFIYGAALQLLQHAGAVPWLNAWFGLGMKLWGGGTCQGGRPPLLVRWL